jgi:uncharacterized membrane protein SirB2
MARKAEVLAFYAQIKWVHIAAVLASGALFALRGLMLHLGAGKLAMSWPLRFLSYGIDTVLLTAALMLFTILPHAMLANGWLATKLVLLPVYVGLGTFALKRGRTAQVRVACWLAAIAVYATMLGIARMHHPTGWLRLIGG